jgi:hypothetical protein
MGFDKEGWPKGLGAMVLGGCFTPTWSVPSMEPHTPAVVGPGPLSPTGCFISLLAAVASWAAAH